MPVKFLLDGPIRLSKTFADWRTLDLSRADQWFRSTVAAWLNLEADRIVNGAIGAEDRAEKWQQARDLRIIGNAVQNNGASGGLIGGLRWRLELEPIAKPETGEAA
jgi:hypothetical protein